MYPTIHSLLINIPSYRLFIRSCFQMLMKIYGFFSNLSIISDPERILTWKLDHILTTKNTIRRHITVNLSLYITMSFSIFCWIWRALQARFRKIRIENIHCDIDLHLVNLEEESQHLQQILLVISIFFEKMLLSENLIGNMEKCSYFIESLLLFIFYN